MTKFFLLPAVAALGLIAACAPASAEEIEIGKVIGEQIGGLLLLVISGAVSTIIGWVSLWLKDKFKIDIEARHREAFRAFIDRQAASLVADGQVWLNGVRVEVKSPALAAATRAALEAVPQARAFFGLTDDRIARMILDALPKVPAVSAAQAIALDVANPATPSIGPAPPAGG